MCMQIQSIHCRRFDAHTCSYKMYVCNLIDGDELSGSTEPCHLLHLTQLGDRQIKKECVLSLITYLSRIVGEEMRILTPLHQAINNIKCYFWG